MLGRTADNLYWMARYMERAENTARLLGGIYRVSLLPSQSADRTSRWAALYHTEEEKKAFLKRFKDFSAGEVLTHMVLDRDNPSSVRSCIRAARENVRATRFALPSELWESINQTWLEIRDVEIDGMMEIGIQEFLDNIKERAHLFGGIAHGDMRRGEAFCFWQLGTFIERAENTTRLLSARLDSFRTAGNRPERASDYYEWGTLLRSLNAFKIYKEIYRGGIEPRRVAELLILHRDVPRALYTSIDEACAILSRLRGDGPSARDAEELRARLQSSTIDRIFRYGLDDFLADFRGRINALGAQIQADFMMVR